MRRKLGAHAFFSSEIFVMQKWKKTVDHNMERWGYLVVRFRWLVIALSLLVVGGFASQMRHLYFDASE